MSGPRASSFPADRELGVAALSPYLPTIDLHGMRRDEVVFEVEQFLGRHSGQIVRVVFGSGEGVLAEVIERHLRYGLAAVIQGFLMDEYRASCVVKLK